MDKFIIPTAFLALFLAGCGLLGFDSDELKDPVRFDLVLDKTVIAPGERFTATYTGRFQPSSATSYTYI